MTGGGLSGGRLRERDEEDLGDLLGALSENRRAMVVDYLVDLNRDDRVLFIIEWQSLASAQQVDVVKVCTLQAF